MRTEYWKSRRSEFLHELNRLENMLSTDEANTSGTFVNVLTVVFDCGFMSEEVFCKKYGLTSEGLKMWMGRSELNHYTPGFLNYPHIYEFIFKEMTKPT